MDNIELAQKILDLNKKAGNHFIASATADINQNITITTPGGITTTAIALSPIKGNCLVFKSDSQWYAIANDLPQVESDRLVVNRRKKRNKKSIPPCTVVGASIWTAVQSIDVGSPSSFEGNTKRPVVNFVAPSWRYNTVSGVCEIVGDGSGDYDTAIECVAANTQASPQFLISNNYYDDDFISSSFRSSNGQSINDLEKGISLRFLKVGARIRPYVEDDSIYGTEQIANSAHQGVTPENSFRLTISLVTNLSDDNDSEYIEVDEDIWGSVTWEENSNPTNKLEKQASLNDTVIVQQNLVSGATNELILEKVGAGSYRHSFLLTYEELINFPGYFFSVSGGLHLPPTVSEDATEQEIEDALAGYTPIYGDTDLFMSVVVARNVYSEVAVSTSKRTFAVKFHDPDLPTILLEPYWAAEIDHIRGYFVYLRNKAYLISKIGKFRNPELDFNQRTWARIDVTEFDLTPEKATEENALTEAKVTQQSYYYPNLPNIPELQDNKNILALLTNYYVDEPLTNPCLATASTFNHQITLEAANYNEVSVQKGYKTKLIEFFRAGQLLQQGQD